MYDIDNRIYISVLNASIYQIIDLLFHLIFIVLI